MRLRTLVRTVVPLAGLTVVAASGLTAMAGPAGAATCAAVDVSFARGTGESAGLGITGGPFVSSLTSQLSDRTVNSYAVNYAASADQSSAGPGGTDMTNHIVSVAAACPQTVFVIGGYSQGASVVDVAIGIQSGGTAIPAALSGRVLAVVAFGNPLGARGGTIARSSAVYGPKSKEYCNSGDPVCGGGGNIAAHLQYASNGSTTAGATFAAGLVKAGGTPTPSPTTPATPPVTSTPTPQPTTPPVTSPPPATTCVRASTQAHVTAGRATSVFGAAYAKGSNDYLGRTSAFVVVSLRQTTTGWERVLGC